MRRERQPGERFGDFTIRAGFVARTGNGRDFHANIGSAEGGMNAPLRHPVPAATQRIAPLARLPLFFSLDRQARGDCGR